MSPSSAVLVSKSATSAHVCLCGGAGNDLKLLQTFSGNPEWHGDTESTVGGHNLLCSGLKNALDLWRNAAYPCS